MSYLCLHDNYGGKFGLKNYEILERERLNRKRVSEIDYLSGKAYHLWNLYAKIHCSVYVYAIIIIDSAVVVKITISCFGNFFLKVKV